MRLDSLDRCKLRIGGFPYFYYDANGGGGNSEINCYEQNNNMIVSFSPDRFSIPPLNHRTTKILGLPLMPGLEIKMIMNKLEGTIDITTGEINFDFKSQFIFSIFDFFFFPALLVETSLTTGEVSGQFHHAVGMQILDDGRATLVGIAVIKPSGNRLLDIFLSLPNEALAVLECLITDNHLITKSKKE